MKTVILILSSLGYSLLALAQNTPPALSIQDAQIDPAAQQATLVYDLSDAEQQACDVWLKVSLDGGQFYTIADPATLSGDVGTGVGTGAGKTLVWNYAGFTDNISSVQLRVYASDGQEVDIQAMADQVEADALKGQLSFIEGVRHFSAGPTQLNAVRDSIARAFAQAGLSTERQLFSFIAQTGQNILGRKAGAKDEAITFILDGHYDGVPNSPAADDNGSAIAGLLEILRILAPYEFEHSICFIGFDFEEQGLIGSQRYVQNAILPYEDLQGVLNLEMIGYYTEVPGSQSLPSGFELLFPEAVAEIEADGYRGNFLAVVGNTNSNGLITDYLGAAGRYAPALKTISLAVPGNGQIAPDLRRSDHAPFWDAGYAALMLTDGADTRNPYYHTPADSIGTLDFDFMANVVKATLGTLAELAVPISAGYDELDLSVITNLRHSHAHEARIDVFPNPARELLNLSFYAPHPIKYRMEIFKLDGQIAATYLLEVPAGESERQLRLPALPAGSYMLVFQSGEGTISKGFVVK